MDLTDFAAERPRLTAIAIRILGSPADADEWKGKPDKGALFSPEPGTP